MTYGIVAHQLEVQDRAAITDLGVRQVRFTVRWNQWHEPAYRDGIERQLTEASYMDLLLVLHGQNPEPIAGFTTFCRDVHRIAPRAYLQPWNEVDHPGGPGNGARFFGLDARAYRDHLTDLKMAIPSARFVTAGLTSHGDTGEWVGTLNNSPAEAVAIHNYGLPIPWQSRYDEVRRYTDLPVWVTEYGINRHGMPQDWLNAHFNGDWEKAQLHVIREAMERPNPYDRRYLHCLWDGEAFGLSILDYDRRPRPVYQWLRDNQARRAA